MAKGFTCSEAESIKNAPLRHTLTKPGGRDRAKYGRRWASGEKEPARSFDHAVMLPSQGIEESRSATIQRIDGKELQGAEGD